MREEDEEEEEESNVNFINLYKTKANSPMENIEMGEKEITENDLVLLEEKGISEKISPT